MSKRASKKVASAPASAGVGAVLAAAAPVEQSASEVLYGSSVLPSMLDIGGEQVQLGTLVAAAHQASGLTVAEWNELAAEVREELLADQLALMREHAEAKASAEQSAASASAAAGKKPAKPDYPRTVTLRNNGPISITDPATGAFLSAGGSQAVTLHDEAQASRLVDNFKSLAERNYLPEGALVIEGLPEKK